MRKSVLLVGQGSQLARAILRSSDDELSLEGVPHTVEWSSLDLRSYDVIVNMAYDPLYMREPYQEARDFDLFVARRANEAGVHYVMLSTRRVYGPVKTLEAIDENYPAAPIDHYGRNKLRTEGAVRELLGDRCTILRVANVFDCEPGRHTFFGIALKNLKTANRITLDASPFVKRDFLHIDDFAAITRAVLAACPSGLFNVGSGTSTEIGKIALWLIEGYGKGELLVISPEHRDAFELDRSKLVTALGSLGASAEIRQQCLAIGAQVAGQVCE